MLNHKRPISIPEIVELLTLPSPVMLEIGCNDGTDTLRFLEITQLQLHCFEPEPRAQRRFLEKVMDCTDPTRQEMELQGIYARRDRSATKQTVWLHPLAVGKEVGKVKFYQSGGTTKGAHLEDWDLSGSIKKPLGHKERHAWCTFDKQIEVPLTTLDVWNQYFQLPRVDFMHVDVQGAEGDVFAGGPELLRKTRYVYCEFNDWKRPLYEGDLNLEQTLAALGPSWEPVALYEGYNVLCRNKEAAHA